ncbi:MAG: spirocyclase AveC family protein [bacterium]
MTSQNPHPIAGTPSRPVLAWAWVGVFWLFIIAVTFSRWIGGGHATPVDPGPDIPPVETERFIIMLDILGPLFFVWILWKIVIAPKLRTGRFSNDGLLGLACLTMFWQDPLAAYASPWFLYNSLSFNLGNWVEFVPGAIAPMTRNVAEPLLWWAMSYLFIMIWITMLGCWCMRKWKQRFPSAGFFSLLAVALAVCIPIDILMEMAALATGQYSYAGSIPEWSLHGGQMWHYPLYEVAWGAFWAVCAVMRYYRDDKGLMFAEKGYDKLKFGDRVKTFIRFLALVGLFNSTMAVYSIYLQVFGINSAAFPAGYPSYLLNGVCGDGTRYACPAPHIPLGRSADGISIDPRLQLHYGTIPKETLLRMEVTN